MSIRPNLLFEFLDRSSVEAARLPPDTCIRVEDLTNGGGEVFREADRVDYDLLVDADGAFAPGLVLRDESGAAIAGILLDHVWGLDLARRIAVAAGNGLVRLEQTGLLEEPGQAIKLAIGQLNLLLKDFPSEPQKKLVEQLRLEVMLGEEPERAVALEGARAAGKRQAQKEHREQILELAKAAAAVDGDTRRSMLKGLAPWIKEVAASGS